MPLLDEHKLAEALYVPTRYVRGTARKLGRIAVSPHSEVFSLGARCDAAAEGVDVAVRCCTELPESRVPRRRWR